MSEEKQPQIHGKPVEMEVNLDDDKGDHPKEFNGATLALDNSKSAPTEPQVEFRGTQSTTMPELSQEGGGLHRDRPFSASMRSTASTKSITSMNPHTMQTTHSATTYFSYRVGVSVSVQYAPAIAPVKSPAIYHVT